MSDGKAFFDTSILLYMYGGNSSKRRRATELFAECAKKARIIVSAQVVQEFYAAGSRKLKIPHAPLREATAALLDLPLVVLGPSHITAAMQNETRYEVSFWDALILAAAQSEDAQLLYTEDLNDGQSYGGVLVVNPFRAT